MGTGSRGFARRLAPPLAIHGRPFGAAPLTTPLAAVVRNVVATEYARPTMTTVADLKGQTVAFAASVVPLGISLTRTTT